LRILDFILKILVNPTY